MKESINEREAINFEEILNEIKNEIELLELPLRGSPANFFNNALENAYNKFLLNSEVQNFILANDIESKTKEDIILANLETIKYLYFSSINKFIPNKTQAEGVINLNNEKLNKKLHEIRISISKIKFSPKILVEDQATIEDRVIAKDDNLNIEKEIKDISLILNNEDFIKSLVWENDDVILQIYQQKFEFEITKISNQQLHQPLKDYFIESQNNFLQYIHILQSLRQNPIDKLLTEAEQKIKKYNLSILKDQFADDEGQQNLGDEISILMTDAKLYPNLSNININNLENLIANELLGDETARFKWLESVSKYCESQNINKSEVIKEIQNLKVHLIKKIKNSPERIFDQNYNFKVDLLYQDFIHIDPIIWLLDHRGMGFRGTLTFDRQNLYAEGPSFDLLIYELFQLRLIHKDHNNDLLVDQLSSMISIIKNRPLDDHDKITLNPQEIEQLTEMLSVDNIFNLILQFQQSIPLEFVKKFQTILPNFKCENILNNNNFSFKKKLEKLSQLRSSVVVNLHDQNFSICDNFLNLGNEFNDLIIFHAMWSIVLSFNEICSYIKKNTDNISAAFESNQLTVYKNDLKKLFDDHNKNISEYKFDDFNAALINDDKLVPGENLPQDLNNNPIINDINPVDVEEIDRQKRQQILDDEQFALDLAQQERDGFTNNNINPQRNVQNQQQVPNNHVVQPNNGQLQPNNGQLQPNNRVNNNTQRNPPAIQPQGIPHQHPNIKIDKEAAKSSSNSSWWVRAISYVLVVIGLGYLINKFFSSTNDKLSPLENPTKFYGIPESAMEQMQEKLANSESFVKNTIKSVQEWFKG